MSKQEESITAMDDLDRNLAAGHIGDTEHAVKRAQLLAVAAVTPHGQRMGSLSAAFIILLVLAALFVALSFVLLRLYGRFLEQLVGRP